MEHDSLIRADTLEAHHIRMARAGVNLSIRDLAQLTGMNKATIVRLEAGKSVRESSIDSIRDVLEAKGVRFWKSKTLNRIVISVDDRSDINGL